MDDLLLLETVERYLLDEMSAEEKSYFDQLRNTNAHIDQIVVEHSMFLHQMNAYVNHKNFKNLLQQTHQDLHNNHIVLENDNMNTKAKVVQLWNRYKKIAGIAASIAGITALCISALVVYFSPVQNPQLKQLSRELQLVKRTQQNQNKLINDVTYKSKIPENAKAISGGSGFLFDGKGFLLTNAHVVKNSKNIIIQNTNGVEFKSKVIYKDVEKDIAIIKITDEDFSNIKNIPFGFKNSKSDLGEQIYTLGFPRNEIVYNEGYISSKTGFEGDSLSWQVTVSANPGNSGAPVLNKNGEIIGIISNMQVQAEGFVFAIKSKYVLKVLEELKRNEEYPNFKIPYISSLKGESRTSQIKKVEDYIYMIKAY